MGKKKKIKSFLNQNKLMIAALGGFTAGISLAGILGTEKAKKIAETVGETVNDFTGKLKEQVSKSQSDQFPLDVDIKTKRHKVEAV